MTQSRELLVESKRMTGTDIAAVTLVPADGQPLDGIEPGAHIDLLIDRAGEPRLVRQYSLCNGPADRRAYVIAVKLEAGSRGGSRWVHSLSPGDKVRLGAVRNLFRLAPTASAHVLMGAGIGITPLLSMAQALHAAAQDYELHYFARGEEHIALREMLAATENAGRLHLHLGLAPSQVPEALSRVLAGARDGAHLYHCGPGPFMDTVGDIALRHFATERIHSERFSSPAAQTAPTSDTSFVVKLVRQGLSCTVQPGTSIAQALLDAGADIELSCEQGVCGTCLTKVLEGVPDHRDAYLSKAERSGGQLMLPCVSRSHSPVLVLDL